MRTFQITLQLSFAELSEEVRKNFAEEAAGAVAELPTLKDAQAHDVGDALIGCIEASMDDGELMAGSEIYAIPHKVRMVEVKEVD